MNVTGLWLFASAGVLSAAAPPLVPLLWTQGQPEETIRRVVREVADGGNTGFVWESRPHPDYLGPNMNPEATAAFLRLTHDATYALFGRHFGRTVKGFFSDETGFRNITS